MEPAADQKPPSGLEIAQAKSWWIGLTDPWKQAFNELMLRRTTLEMPDDLSLHGMFTAQTLRFTGPKAPYPSTSVELEDLSGIAGLKHVTILIVAFHRLKHLRELSEARQLSSLFVNNNQISTLEGIEHLENLRELYFNVNLVESLVPLTTLSGLHTIYCNYNRIPNLDGITAGHRGNLRNFVCLPNDLLSDTEIIRMEREIGIRCKKG